MIPPAAAQCNLGGIEPPDWLVEAAAAAAAAAAPTVPTIADAFAWYQMIGVRCCAIAPNSKSPSAPQWQKLGRELPEAPPEQYGLGLLHASSKTCALDIDDLAKARELLAGHGIDLDALLAAPDAVRIDSGRPGRGKLIYRLGDPLPTRKVVRDGKTILELRCATAAGDNVQDVLPPSVHPETGLPYVFKGDGSIAAPAPIPPALLAFWQGLQSGGASAPIVVGGLSSSWDEVRSALFSIDPSCNRAEWIKVGMALKMISADQKDDEVPLALFNEWSSGSKEKYKAREIADQWRSFKTDVDGVGIGSLFYLARTYGWERPAPDVTGMFPTVEERRAEDKLIGEGVTYDIKNPPLPEMMDVEEMERRFVYVSSAEAVVDLHNPRLVLSLSALKNAFAGCATLKTRPDGRVSCVPNTKLWQESNLRRTVDAITWKPVDQTFLNNPDGLLSINTYRSFAWPEFEPDQAAVDFFLAHIRWLFGDQAESFLDWYAHIEQCPEVLPGTCHLHIAPHTGLGRNWISSLSVRLWRGEVASSFKLETMLKGGFNGRLSQKRLAVVDEIHMSGNGTYILFENFKEMVTEELRRINPKYGREHTEFNCCRFLVFSNHRSALPIDKEDRRINVAICDEREKGAKYYVELYGMLERPSALLSIKRYLADRDLSQFNPGARAVESMAKRQAIMASKSDTEMAIEGFLSTVTARVVTGRQIREGIEHYSTGDSGSANFNHMVTRCGWLRLDRRRHQGGLETFYCRTEDHDSLMALKNSGGWSHLVQDTGPQKFSFSQFTATTIKE